MQSDAELLAEWVARRSEAAFARLVERYVALVHSAARRQVSDPHLAEEITQAVFILLARKAGSLGRQTVLAGWLCRTAHFAARDALRTECRRQHREQLAAHMDTTPDAAWQQLAPLLDEAVAQLRKTDRNAIVLRYYEQRPLDEVGATLGIGADAAQKRVARALEKLRVIFAKRGVTLTGAAIAGAVSANAVQAVPVGLAVKISAAALVAGTTITTTTIVTSTLMNWAKTKAIAVVVASTLAAGTATYLVQKRERNDLRNENQNLLAQQQKIITERDAALSAAAANRDELERLGKYQNELLRLRSEVGMLRRQTSELGRLRTAAKAATAPEPAQADSEVELRERMPRLARLIARPLLMYAAENQGRFPSNFAEAAPFFQKAAQQADPFLGDERDLVEATNHFEITFYGSRDTLTNAGSVILLRERLARQRPDGYWERAYVKASGTVSVAVSSDGNFETRERELQTVPTDERRQAVIRRY